MYEPSLEAFADKWNEVMPSIAREIARRQVNPLFRGKITLPQFIILEYLSREEESKMTELARVINVTTAATTGIVDRLVRDGYVKRSYEPKDRRVVKIKLTAKGSEVLKKINSQRHQMAMRIFDKITPHERDEYLRILLRIQDILIKENAA